MISVIVPVYNIEQYIEACICSILNQTYQNLEIILVDDGSTDSSGKICDRYAEADARIVVVHKQNGGLSDARNIGLDKATGEYIGLVDGDDYIHPQMYEHLYNTLIKYDADFSFCDYEETKALSQIQYDFIEKTEKVSVFENEAVYQLATNLRTKDVVAWNKLYKKEIFEGLSYELGRLHEDQWIIPNIVMRCKKIVYCDEKLYYYVVRKDSISKSKVSPKRMYDLLDALSNSCKIFRENGLYDEQKMVARHLCNYIIAYYESAANDMDEPQKVRKELHAYFSKVMRLNKNVFSIRQLVYQLFLINPCLGIMMKKVREII